MIQPNIYLIKFCLLIFFINLNLQAQTLVIDPGHGGSDKGVTRSTFIESELTLKLALLIQEELIKKHPHVKTILTRESDINLSLNKRIEFAHQQNADLILSLHANSSPSTQVSGMEFYFKNKDTNEKSNKTNIIEVTTAKKHLFKLNTNTQFNKKHEKIIQKIFEETSNFGLSRHSLMFSEILSNNSPAEKNVIRRAPYFIIENSKVPAVLIELGFITNLKEARMLYTDSYQQEIAQSIVNSIEQYFSLQL